MEFYELIQQIFSWMKMTHDNTPYHVKISGFVLIAISFWKSSFARKFLWNRLGPYKVLLAPLLGFLSALVAVQPFTKDNILAGISGGILASGFHEVLDAFKSLPRLGPKYRAFIHSMESLLKSPDSE